jgi:hypothetical protein
MHKGSWLSCAAAVAVSAQLSCTVHARAPEMFDPVSCAGQQRGWTGEELAVLAFRHAGYPGFQDGATVRYMQEDCEISVVVGFHSGTPGDHFLVVLSAQDGSLIRFLPGQ